MEVWHDILEGIGLSVIILAVVIGILYYDSAPKQLRECFGEDWIKNYLRFNH